MTLNLTKNEQTDRYTIDTGFRGKKIENLTITDLNKLWHKINSIVRKVAKKK